jgi:hypothetical protein
VVPDKKSVGRKKQAAGEVGSKTKGKGKAKAKRSRKGKAKGARKNRKGREPVVDPDLHVVLKNPVRLQILAVAIQRAISPKEFADEALISPNLIAYDFRVLREHGFLEIVEEVKVRGATKHMHRATKSGFISDVDWGAVAQKLRPGIAGTILQDFNGRVTQAMETGILFERDDACLYWAPVDLDEIAWVELVELMAWCIEESKRLVGETINRRAKGDGEGDGFHASFAIAGFPSPTHKEVKAQEKRKKKAVEKLRKKKSQQTKRKTKSRGKGKGAGKDATEPAGPTSGGK